MGGKRHNKKKQEKSSESGADQNPTSENIPQSSGNQSRPTPPASENRPDNQPDKQPKPNVQQGSDNRTKSNANQPKQKGSQNRPSTSNNQENKPSLDQLKQMSISSDRQQNQQQPQRQQGPQQSKKLPVVAESSTSQQPKQKEHKQLDTQNAWQQPSTSNASKKSPAQQQDRPGGQSKQQDQKQPKTKSARQQPSTSNAAKQQQASNKQSVVPQAQAQSMSKQSLTAVENSPTTSMPYLLCPYKGAGTRGTPFKSLIETNYLKLLINKMKDCAYHYDVVIVPDKPKKHMSKIFQQFCMNNWPDIGIAFDGSRNAYAPMVLSLEEIEIEVDFVHPETGGVRRYVVNIKETDDMKIPLNSLRTYQSTRQYDMPKKALQCIEIILKGAYQQKHLEMGIQAARSFYLPSQKRKYLGDFFELWLGLFQSTVLGSQIYINVDVAHKAFPERYDSLLGLLQQVQDERCCDQRNAIEYMRSHLSGLDVIYKTPGNAGNKRVYKFMGLVGNPSQERFTDQNGRQITVAAYFSEQNYPITRPDLPCVKLGNTIKSIVVPMEHCSLSDRQAINRRCTENQTREIIKVAATSTDVRKQKIMELLDQIKHNQSPIIRGFGLELDTKFAKVQARCLDAPKILYAGNKLVDVKNGVWRGEGMPFLIPESANKWAILNANQRTRNNELQDLALNLPKYGRSTNLNLADRPAFTRVTDARNIEKELANAKNEGIRILFCVIPDSGPTYAKIKQLAEMRVGVLTQCIKGGTVFKKRNDGSTISNILLKVNAKLNGTNHRLNDSPILYEKSMVIGADVTHPSPDQKSIPSVVGVAASHDANAFCYNVCWRLQGPRIEIIQDFRQIMVEHLKFYQKKNGCLPNKILYYRDGVSEGQFQQVMASEKMAMSQACAEIEPGYEKRVKLTIIVVQKRHHTRFFPGSTGIGGNDRRNNNVPAGTIVDTEITHPNENHFYLVSHQSIQGVAKPTKYCILLDEANHSIDDLQGLSYNLCHLFSRCNRSVSYPAPTYYAHLAAYRGRVYIENERLNMNNLGDEWRRRAIRDDIAKAHPMFFV